MHFFKLLLLLVICVAGCAPHFKYSNLYDRSTVAEIESTYQRLFDAENEVKPADAERLLDNFRALRRGNEEYHTPAVLSMCYDLRT